MEHEWPLSRALRQGVRGDYEGGLRKGPGGEV